ncbi:MAG: hypothetical protein U9Q03_06100 [Patescibacteria group bacterium]|nr:hypothetical protein [Patescibacteria group bacterium]
MFLTVHSAIGVTAVTAIGITNPAAAFALGWALHYVGDAIPHGDERIGDWVLESDRSVRRAIPFFAGDFAVMSAAFLMYSMSVGFHWHFAAVVAGSILPDVMFGMEMVFKRNVFGFLTPLHKKAHRLTGVRLPLWLGLSGQAIIALLLWFR